MPAIKRVEGYYNLMPIKINECNGQKKQVQTPYSIYIVYS